MICCRNGRRRHAGRQTYQHWGETARPTPVARLPDCGSLPPPGPLPALLPVDVPPTGWCCRWYSLHPVDHRCYLPRHTRSQLSTHQIPLHSLRADRRWRPGLLPVPGSTKEHGSYVETIYTSTPFPPRLFHHSFGTNRPIRSNVGRAHQLLGTGQVTSIYPVRLGIPRFARPFKKPLSIPIAYPIQGDVPKMFPKCSRRLVLYW